MWSRRQLLTTLASAPLWSAACDDADPVADRPAGEKTFREGASWLWKQRRKDGMWQSPILPELASGHLLTALCLAHLTDLPREEFEFPREDAIASLEWFVRTRTFSFALGFLGERPEHPTWATSAAMLAYARVRAPNWYDSAGVMSGWLRRQQVRVEGHPLHGGFCTGYFRRPPSDAVFEADLSLTRYAVQSLDALAVHANDPAMKAARGFVDRCRTPAGDYAASPERVGAGGNGPATADAVLTLICMGVEGEELAPHLEALTRSHALDRAPGLPEEEALGRRYAYLATAAAVFERAGGPPGWADAMVRSLTASRSEDGSWLNPVGGWREEEPLLSTAWALSALGCALRSWPAVDERRK